MHLLIDYKKFPIYYVIFISLQIDIRRISDKHKAQTNGATAAII